MSAAVDTNVRRAVSLSVCMLLASLVSAPVARTGDGDGDVLPLPETLRGTGLYADWDTRVVAAGNLPYSPQYALWTDGATKSRWLHLPPGAWIESRLPASMC